MPRNGDDFDFKIFVDPSCLSEPMDDDTSTAAQPLPTAVASEIVDIPVDMPVATEHPENTEAEQQVGTDPSAIKDEPSPEPHLSADESFESKHAADPDQVASGKPDDNVEAQEDVGDAGVIADDSTLESEHGMTQEEPAEITTSHNNATGEELNEFESHSTQVEGPQDDPEGVQEHSSNAGDAETPKPIRNSHFDAEDGVEPRRNPSTSTDRKASLRTEALIQAAARAVVAKLEERTSGNRDSIGQDEEEADQSLLSTGTQETYDGLEDADRSYEEHFNASRRESTDSQLHHDVASRSVSGDEGGDSSSHHEADDDVFSDRSARSSLASFDGANDIKKFQQPCDNDQSQRQSLEFNARSPRISGVSIISGLSQYDKEDFVPMSRETRIPFRTPSAVRAMQMTSPTPSVFNAGSPRSAKRQTGSVTRSAHMHSPTASAQYSPKGRSTPTRFKSRKAAPLVLLHVTLLPLRWMWGDVLNGLDAVDGKSVGEGEIFEASDQLKTLRDAWRELQDCVGDTVFERGVLIPHPQNDYEVLEERLLEALELPLRRRARILECGHYLGPANMMDDEDGESEDDYASEPSRAKEDKRHWCNTCKGDIKYEDLGPGRVFRVKVYASNGLMKAGAWEACWNDMERVDVEVEPIVEPATQAELERLTAIQIELEEQRQQQEADAEAAAEAEAEAELRREAEVEAELRREAESERDRHADKREVGGESLVDETLPIPSDPELPYMEAERHYESPALSSSPPAAMQVAMHASPPQAPSSSVVRLSSPALVRDVHSSRSMRSEPIDMSEERMRRDEERLREIYGGVPTPQPFSETHSSVHAQPSSSVPRHSESYIPPPTPRSPSEEAYERRQQREAQHRVYESASFIELLLEAFKVLLQDPKNVAIIVLCLFLVCLMIRPTPQVPAFGNDRLAYRYDAKQEVMIHTPSIEAETQVHRGSDELALTQTKETTMQAPSIESVSNLIMATSAAALGLDAPAPGLSSAESLPSVAPEVDLDREVIISDSSEAEPETSISEETVDTSLPIADQIPLSEVEYERTFSQAAEAVEADQDTVSSDEDEPVLPAFTQAAEAVETDQHAASSGEDDPTLPASTQAAEVVQIDQDTVSSDGDESTLPTSEPVLEAEASTSFDAPEILPSTPPEASEQADEEISITTTTADEVSVTATTAEEIVEAAETSASAMAEETLDDETFYPAAPIGHNVTDIVDEVVAEGPHPCESYARSARLSAQLMAASLAPLASSSTFHAFPVTQKTTIRVFETITETVRVSVTATETVSFVETAVPQTVEETVYETETVRITVSIPVDSAPEPSPARDEL